MNGADTAPCTANWNATKQDRVSFGCKLTHLNLLSVPHSTIFAIADAHTPSVLHLHCQAEKSAPEFDETGLFAAVCRHDIVHAMCDIIQSGEK